MTFSNLCHTMIRHRLLHGLMGISNINLVQFYAKHTQQMTSTQTFETNDMKFAFADHVIREKKWGWF